MNKLIPFLLLFSCQVQPMDENASNQPLINIGGPISNYAVFQDDTIYSGQWDTGVRQIHSNGDTIVYECAHLFHSYYWRWCGDSLFELDTNVTLKEVNKKIDFFDSNFWCLNNFHLVTLRTDSTFQLKSEFNRGDTIFHQSAYTKLNDYWLVE